MMKKLLAFLMMLLPLLAEAQMSVVSGYVTDASNGERLIGATVYESRTRKGTVTNGYGFYSLTLPFADTTELIFSYVGFEEQHKLLKINGNIKLNVALESKLTLNEVVVTAEAAERPVQQRLEMSSISLPVREAKLLPALGGESDVMKAVQLMPGVQSGNEGTSGLYVRGGSPDQNLMILDDAPLYYVNHLGGFVSIFNTDAISSINLIKGGFPARYGNRLSSVMDVRMKDGNMKEHHGDAMIGMVASKIALEGPIKKDTSSYLVSVRRFMYDIFMRPLSKVLFENTTEAYSFYDFNVKLNYRLSDKDALYLSLYSGRDRISTKIKEKVPNGSYVNRFSKSWGNQLAALRWNHLFGPKLFSNTTLSYTRYHYRTDLQNETDLTAYNEIITDNYLSSINDFSLKSDFQFYQSEHYRMLFGVSSVLHQFKPNTEEYSENYNGFLPIDTVFGNGKLLCWENAAYIENEIYLSENIAVNAGLRLVHNFVEDTSFLHLEPRLLLNWQIGSELSLKASYSRMCQNVHLLTNSGSGMPTDLWLPATKDIVPEDAAQFVVGLATTQQIKGQTFDFSAELFYKQMRHLIAYKTGVSTQSAIVDWQKKIEKDGQGTAKGVELLARKSTGRTTGWIGCTLSRTTRQFDNINDGKPYLFKYDRPLDLSLAVVHKLTANISCSMTWVYGTGNAFTLPVGAYSALTDDGWETVYIYEGINTFRMRSYHRLDVGISFEKQKEHGTRVWNVSVYNAYNRMNPYFYYFQTDWQAHEIKLMQVTMFPIMPSVSYEYKF